MEVTAVEERSGWTLAAKVQYGKSWPVAGKDGPKFFFQGGLERKSNRGENNCEFQSSLMCTKWQIYRQSEKALDPWLRKGHTNHPNLSLRQKELLGLELG